VAVDLVDLHEAVDHLLAVVVGLVVLLVVEVVVLVAAVEAAVLEDRHVAVADPWVVVVEEGNSSYVAVCV